METTQRHPLTILPREPVQNGCGYSSTTDRSRFLRIAVVGLARNGSAGLSRCNRHVSSPKRAPFYTRRYGPSNRDNEINIPSSGSGVRKHRPMNEAFDDAKGER